ncbi:sodium-translocating pyrophosphatase [Chryseobacterium binzhouense]|uniref:sodium-translocating pyrophosphatase n=1 Tax=Chryseobacterium binzhouense TaxID=2593646 RepID=UPI002896CAAC|nr:sodium-translocating pyrophosphatase [Chryseobacterium binzhouense]
MSLFMLVPIFGVIALLYTFLQSNWVSRQNAGNEKMKQISGYIADGAMAFLKAEYKILTYFVIIVAILLAFMGMSNANSHWSIGVAFVIGAVFSALAGFIGMKIATKANVRTAEAAKTSLSKALKVSFTGGSVMGMGVAGLAVLGLGALYLIIKQIFAPNSPVDSHEMEKTIEILTGFSLGAESIALFARVGGGIYTKAADVGADLVGKVEAGIPEDDPRNPATIADNVGDNVGDVAGMGADLFGSYVATVLATMVLGRETVSVDDFGGFAPILLPMLIAGTGILFSIIGTFFVKISDNEGTSTSNVQNALNLGNWSSIIITAIASYFLVTYLLPEKMVLRGFEFTKNGVFGAIIVGLVVGTLMSIITEYYTAMGKRPVSSIVRQSSTGHATNIIGGLSVGMESTFLPIIVLAGGIYGSYLCAGLYGVAIAAAGMMATTAMQLAIDAFGPIADNAGGIAEMSELPKEVRENTDILDAVGNTTAASGKGFAIASAALTALALFAAFVGIAGIDGIDIYKADVLAGLFVGGMIPFIFSSLAITAVGQAAMAMVEEVRRQFREIPGILEGKGEPEYQKCVAISTDASIKKMMLPGAIAIASPLLIGFIFGPEVLGGFLAGATVSGVLMGIFQNNAGGAWDNAKKSFEKGVDINGETYYKGSDPHKASVTGDTVGDPFKDTSGPSMNILIKLMSIVSLVIAPTLAVLHKDKIDANRKAKIESLTGVKSNSIISTENDNSQEMSSPEIMKGQLNEFGDFVYETGQMRDVKLSNGNTISLGENSQLFYLNNKLTKKDKELLNPEKWFTIENLYFESGSSDLRAGSESHLKNLAEIMNAYPELRIKLGGYTDNSGSEETNMKLSNLRAQTTKLKLLEMGIAGDRIEAEGYGSQFPFCTMDESDECHAKNRRIDVRVLAY